MLQSYFANCQHIVLSKLHNLGGAKNDPTQQRQKVMKCLASKTWASLFEHKKVKIFLWVIVPLNPLKWSNFDDCVCTMLRKRSSSKIRSSSFQYKWGRGRYEAFSTLHITEEVSSPKEDPIRLNCFQYQKNMYGF